MAAATASAWDLSPQEAGEVLAEWAADFRPAVPTAEQVQDYHDARARLTALTNDATWTRKYLEGSLAEVREFEQLTKMIANEAEPIGYQESHEVLMEGQLPRVKLISAISHMGKVGIPAEGIERIVTGDFSAEDIEWGRQQLDRAMATKEWTDGLLRGDPTCVHEFWAYTALVAAGKAA
jgi:hypothetical protein